ncbi:MULTISPECIES: lysozyme [unclassified Methylobacterium]|uniref:lysozyme n=1 Tax=unclassified Methylobacterium TaxID=2615210 RepID=UPI0008E50321|nr:MULTISPECIES: lysozyme [unclassified Methylobacterium]SFU50650.1 lysozyme [Methylobacterium sp. UNCCL125]
MAFNLSALFRRRPTAAAPVSPLPVGRVPSVPLKAPAAKGTLRRRMVAGTAAAALAVTFVQTREGTRLKAYRDIVGVATICNGETRGVTMDMTATPQQCAAMLLKGLGEFEGNVLKCVPGLASAPDERLVAHVSLAYNIGAGAYCKSTVARRYNAGDIAGSCDAFDMWDKAGGRRVKGLSIRRDDEQVLCRKGL